MQDVDKGLLVGLFPEMSSLVVLMASFVVLFVTMKLMFASVLIQKLRVRFRMRDGKLFRMIPRFEVV